jgi:hypothetical protein
MAGPLLGGVMTPDVASAHVEPMVDARTAHQALCIPLQWLNNKTQRRVRGVPAYRIGHLVRFRLSELEQWRDRNATIVAPAREVTDGQ